MPKRAGTIGLLKPIRIAFWAVAASVAVIDLWTKHLVFLRLPRLDSEPIVIIDGFLRFVHSENRGGVFGLAQGSWLWLVLAIGASVFVLWFAHKKETRGIWTQLALGLVLAGAIGNVYDRIMFGYVRDFIDVYWRTHHWPAFNVADSGICVGALMLGIYAFFLEPKKPTAKTAGNKCKSSPRSR